MDSTIEHRGLNTADDITVGTMTRKGLDPLGEKLRASLRDRFRFALHRLGKLGRAEKIGRGIGAGWIALTMG